ncbi:hypothetical protein [Bacillus sp. AFS017336]|uniref:hypothetical protein n=1 Tax=Bacillus sp. AFS017336 TaxID=2033489 RepID=UPI000BF05BF8|nr:hypothetical protein [Bacillus sp. AFS017336]PEK98331.1 hypothetical protein CN601_25830 [Bacillus sp. AFS017336]
MLEDLEEAITRLSDKTNVDIHLVGFKKYLDKITVTIYLTFGLEEEIEEEWQIVCDDFGTHRFEYDVFEEWEIVNEHELLWEYNKKWISISFNGKSNLTAEVIGELYKTHLDNTNGFVAFDEYLNKCYRIDKLLDGGFGHFAFGPIKILELYRNVLNKYGYKTSVLPRDYRTPMDYKTDYRLLIMGNSYIVAKKFTAHQIKR